MNFKILRRHSWPLLLGFFLACRFLLLCLAPHADPSESRYAEIARKMVETGDWITPQFDYGVPFWGKPPLSIWLSALGMELFGVNEFGSRIFLFLLALGILAMVAGAGRRELGKDGGWIAALLLAAMPVFFYCSAAVMTDIALLAGTTLAILCFRQALLSGSRVHGYGIFVGLAIGLLAKGPLTLVIALPPMIGWLVLTGRWRIAGKRLPWLSGILLMLALALPWYVAAERKTPGFLDYFLVGEHWQRFMVRGWQGDLYGNAHPVAPGMIWVYFLLGSFPWSLGLLAVLPLQWRACKEWALAEDGRGLYWLLWALWPVMFFTPARNIIASYPLPALPALALLLAEFQIRSAGSAMRWRPLHPALAGIGAALVLWALAVLLLFPAHAPKQSERSLVRRFELERGRGDCLIYYGSRKYSAEFYSEGAVRQTTSAEELEARLNAPGRCFVALPAYWMPLVPEAIRQRLLLVASWGQGPSLYVERSESTPVAVLRSTNTSPATTR